MSSNTILVKSPASSHKASGKGHAPALPQVDAPTEAPALSRGLDLLKRVAVAPDGMSFNEIIDAMNVPRATTARLLRVLLAQQDLVKKQDDGRYCIGPSMAVFSQTGDTTARLERTARPLLRNLRDALGHSLLLMVFDRSQQPVQMVCLAKAQHEDSFAMQPEGRRSTDVDVNPWGWLYYSLQPRSEQRMLERQMNDAKAFRAQWTAHSEFIDKHGFAFDDDGPQIGLRRLATPIRNSEGHMVAALGLGAVSKALPKAQIPVVGSQLQRVAEKIEQSMGWRRSDEHE